MILGFSKNVLCHAWPGILVFPSALEGTVSNPASWKLGTTKDNPSCSFSAYTSHWWITRKYWDPSPIRVREHYNEHPEEKLYYHVPRQRNLCVKGREEAAESLTVVFNRPATNLAESVIHSHSSAEAEARICESLDKELSEEKTDGAVVSDQVNSQGDKTSTL